MNERIQELNLEAMSAVLNGTDPDGDVDGMHILAEFTKKFAELIVQECLKQIDTIRDGCDEDGEHQQALGADWAGLAVARHFGVEE